MKYKKTHYISKADNKIKTAQHIFVIKTAAKLHKVQCAQREATAFQKKQFKKIIK